MQVIQFLEANQKHACQHLLSLLKPLISFHKAGLSTEVVKALSTTTTLFYKKEIRRQANSAVKKQKILFAGDVIFIAPIK
jgi:hypothetical protein